MAGLQDFWETWYTPNPRECIEITHQKNKPRLSLRHLSSAFAVLIVGMLISFVTFLLENVVSACLYSVSYKSKSFYKPDNGKEPL